MEERRRVFTEKDKQKAKEANKQTTMLRYQDAILPSVDDLCVSDKEGFMENLRQESDDDDVSCQ